MNGVVIVPNHQKSMSGIEEAMNDIRHGRVTEYESADDMFEKLGMSYYARLAVDMETI